MQYSLCMYVKVQSSALFRHSFISDHKFSFYNPTILETASNKIRLKVIESLNRLLLILLKEYSEAKSLKCNMQSLEGNIC